MKTTGILFAVLISSFAYSGHGLKKKGHGKAGSLADLFACFAPLKIEGTLPPPPAQKAWEGEPYPLLSLSYKGQLGFLFKGSKGIFFIGFEKLPTGKKVKRKIDAGGVKIPVVVDEAEGLAVTLPNGTKMYASCSKQKVAHLGYQFSAISSVEVDPEFSASATPYTPLKVADTDPQLIKGLEESLKHFLLEKAKFLQEYVKSADQNSLTFEVAPDDAIQVYKNCATLMKDSDLVQAADELEKLSGQWKSVLSK